MSAPTSLGGFGVLPASLTREESEYKYGEVRGEHPAMAGVIAMALLQKWKFLESPVILTLKEQMYFDSSKTTLGEGGGKLFFFQFSVFFFLFFFGFRCMA